MVKIAMLLEVVGQEEALVYILQSLMALEISW